MKQLTNVQHFIEQLHGKMENILQQNFVGSYIHGSLALGGFNEATSDIDLMVVTETALSISTKKQLATLFLATSTHPYPIEISFLHVAQLQTWQHPCPYDFHYSEFWRARYHTDLSSDTTTFIHQADPTDADLAAHITIVNDCGICYKGKPIHEVFPSIPKSDYLNAIMIDFYDCLETIHYNPVYCILNTLRVYLFLMDGIITSKQEAGAWGSQNLLNSFQNTITKALNVNKSNGSSIPFSPAELNLFQHYISEKVEELL